MWVWTALDAKKHPEREQETESTSNQSSQYQILARGNIWVLYHNKNRTDNARNVTGTCKMHQAGAQILWGYNEPYWRLIPATLWRPFQNNSYTRTSVKLDFLGISWHMLVWNKGAQVLVRNTTETHKHPNNWILLQIGSCDCWWVAS